jgi:hypothetical protein
MKKINNIKLKTLKQTRAFYIWELRREESLTLSEKSKYLLALKSISRIIREKEESIIKKGKASKTVFCPAGLLKSR